MTDSNEIIIAQAAQMQAALTAQQIQEYQRRMEEEKPLRETQAHAQETVTLWMQEQREAAAEERALRLREVVALEKIAQALGALISE